MAGGGGSPYRSAGEVRVACARCGAEGARAGYSYDDDGEALLCPRCRMLADAPSTEYLVCPDCKTLLKAPAGTRPLGQRCSRCGGLSTTVEALRKTVAGGFVNRVWQAALALRETGDRACPSCRNAMQIVVANDGLTVDVCLPCHLLWLDAGEPERLPARRPGEST